MSRLRVAAHVCITGGVLFMVQGFAVLLGWPEPLRVGLVLVVGLGGAAWLLLAGRARTVDPETRRHGGPAPAPQVRGSRPAGRGSHG